jgi:dienelactone hydrolase
MRPAAALFAVLALAGLVALGPGRVSEPYAQESAGAGEGGLLPASDGAADADLAATWDHAQIYLRYEDEDFNLRIIGGALEAPYIQAFLAQDASDPQPVVIHLHGCQRSDDLADIRNQGRALAEMGFIVVVPDSFARADRPETCDPLTLRRVENAPFAQVQRWRIEELAYALKQVLAAPWADKSKIFAGGFDEGGDAVLAFADPALAGRFAIGAPCRFAPAAAPMLPTLVIASKNDLWFDGEHEAQAQGRCRRLLRGQSNVGFFAPEGVLHDALIYEEARIALWNFLVRASFL